MKKWVFRIVLSLVTISLIVGCALFIINRHVDTQTADKIQSSIIEISREDPSRIAIVFGARVWNNGVPSNSLYDRVFTAVELYRTGRVKKLLMSGDNPNPDYDEPTAMKKTAIDLGVPEADIVLDFAGRRTYDTCYRAKEIFGVEKAILVSQDYHLPRAIYLCQNLGVDSIAIKANRRTYDGENYYHFREFFSVASAWFEMNFIPFEPSKGEKQPIQQ